MKDGDVAETPLHAAPEHCDNLSFVHIKFSRTLIGFFTTCSAPFRKLSSPRRVSLKVAPEDNLRLV